MGGGGGGGLGSALAWVADPIQMAEGTAESAAMGGGSSSAKSPATPGVVPNQQNSNSTLMAAQAAQRLNRGAYNTIFAGRNQSGLNGPSAARTILGT